MSLTIETSAFAFQKKEIVKTKTFEEEQNDKAYLLQISLITQVATHVLLKIYNKQGELIARLASGLVTASRDFDVYLPKNSVIVEAFVAHKCTAYWSASIGKTTLVDAETTPYQFNEHNE